MSFLVLYHHVPGLLEYHILTLNNSLISVPDPGSQARLAPSNSTTGTTCRVDTPGLSTLALSVYWCIVWMDSDVLSFQYCCLGTRIQTMSVLDLDPCYLAEKARLPFVRIRHVPLTLSVPDLADWTKHDQRSTLVCRCASQLHVPSWPDSFRRRHVHPMIGVTKPKGSVAWGSCEAILDWVDSVPSLRSPLTTKLPCRCYARCLLIMGTHCM